MLIQLISHEDVNTVDEKCGEGLYIFMIYFELKCFKYCLGDSPLTHKSLLFILVSQNLNACQMLRS